MFVTFFSQGLLVKRESFGSDLEEAQGQNRTNMTEGLVFFKTLAVAQNELDHCHFHLQVSACVNE